MNAQKKQSATSEYIYILIETMIFVGPSLVAKTKENHIYLAQDHTLGDKNENFDVFDMYLTNMADKFVSVHR